MAVFEELLDRSETMTRAALRAIPEGTYRYVDYLDNDGIDLDKPVRIEVAVTVRDGTIEFDLTGTDPQLKGPLNCVPSGSQAAAYFAVRVLTDRDDPDQRRLLQAGDAEAAERLARQSGRARAGQRAHVHDQAHRDLHGERARRDPARSRRRAGGGHAARRRVRRAARERRALHRAAS